MMTVFAIGLLILIAGSYNISRKIQYDEPFGLTIVIMILCFFALFAVVVASQITCTTCNGYGKVVCDDCNNVVTCPNCNDYGKITCRHRITKPSCSCSTSTESVPVEISEIVHIQWR